MCVCYESVTVATTWHKEGKTKAGSTVLTLSLEISGTCRDYRNICMYVRCMVAKYNNFFLFLKTMVCSNCRNDCEIRFEGSILFYLVFIVIISLLTMLSVFMWEITKKKKIKNHPFFFPNTYLNFEFYFLKSKTLNTNLIDRVIFSQIVATQLIPDTLNEEGNWANSLLTRQ